MVDFKTIDLSYDDNGDTYMMLLSRYKMYSKCYPIFKNYTFVLYPEEIFLRKLFVAAFLKFAF